MWLYQRSVHHRNLSLPHHGKLTQHNGWNTLWLDVHLVIQQRWVAFFLGADVSLLKCLVKFHNLLSKIKCFPFNIFHTSIRITHYGVHGAERFIIANDCTCAYTWITCQTITHHWSIISGTDCQLKWTFYKWKPIYMFSRHLFSISSQQWDVGCNKESNCRVQMSVLLYDWYYSCYHFFSSWLLTHQ